MNRLVWLNGEQGTKIKPLLPHYGGPQRADDRRVLSGIIHVPRTGMPRRDGPSGYGPSTTIYNRFKRWASRGIWQRIHATLTGDHRPAREILADGSHLKAHRAASAAQKGGRRGKPLGGRAAGERLRSRP